MNRKTNASLVFAALVLVSWLVAFGLLSQNSAPLPSKLVLTYLIAYAFAAFLCQTAVELSSESPWLKVPGARWIRDQGHPPAVVRGIPLAAGIAALALVV